MNEVIGTSLLKERNVARSWSMNVNEDYDGIKEEETEDSRYVHIWRCP